LAPALSFAPKETIKKYCRLALGAMKIALRVPKSSSIKGTLEVINQVHPWEWIYKT